MGRSSARSRLEMVGGDSERANVRVAGRAAFFVASAAAAGVTPFGTPTAFSVGPIFEPYILE